MIYSYHERVNGDYNKEETKTFKKKVGVPFDDTSLEKLAGAVMAQLARRDVWIVDVEIFELSKKSISFKEAKGGIILKNKKFLFDGGGEDSSSIMIQDMMSQSTVPQYTAQEYIPPPQHNNVNIQQSTQVYRNLNVQPHEQGMPRRPIDQVVFSPELHLMTEIKQKNLRFTPDKKYAVFEKRPAPGGMEVYLMLDDTQREQLVSDRYFVPGNVQLFAGELGFTQGPEQRDGGKLYWGGANQEPDMPDVRRR